MYSFHPNLSRDVGWKAAIFEERNLRIIYIDRISDIDQGTHLWCGERNAKANNINKVNSPIFGGVRETWEAFILTEKPIYYKAKETPNLSIYLNWGKRPFLMDWYVRDMGSIYILTKKHVHDRLKHCEISVKNNIREIQKKVKDMTMKILQRCIKSNFLGICFNFVLRYFSYIHLMCVFKAREENYVKYCIGTNFHFPPFRIYGKLSKCDISVFYQ